MSVLGRTATVRFPNRDGQLRTLRRASRMLAEAARCHGSERVRWIAGVLPGLDAVYRLGFTFDVMLLNIIWMRVAPADR